MRIKAPHIFIMLSILFLVYSFSIYLNPRPSAGSDQYNKTIAADGKLVWQKYNCQSCHQLYGLGGYLGPDLTNVMSNPLKGEYVARLMIRSGTRQMPAYHLSKQEMNELVEFLKSADASGQADPRNFKADYFGMTERK